MSEYQYYEFQAIDRPLSPADRQELRALSTRARITATSFTNHYNWGDFRGDPAKLMERWFDLHLYFANWGTRRLMIRWPQRLVDRARLDRFLREVECAELQEAGDYLILDILRDDEPGDVEYREWDEGEEEDSGWLAALAPLRGDVIDGDLRLFYLLWLIAVEDDAFEPEEAEPLPGIGPMTASLEAFAEFFGLNPDLVAAAAERSAPNLAEAVSADAARGIIAALDEREKTALLLRLYQGDPHAAIELRAAVREHATPIPAAPVSAGRAVGELRARAEAIRRAREQAAAERAEAERRRQAEEAEKARRERLKDIVRKGERVWAEIEGEIERRNPAGYDRAASLLADLRSLAEERGTTAEFARRLQAIRERHARKERFLARLAGMG
ncbi:MAG TPA: hypothetical protein VJ770_10300 [Stellaceae bacterium]|nr:hypothetical protein [Stellaceae bacterium]